MGVGAGLYVYDVVVKKYTFAISSPDLLMNSCVISFYNFLNQLLDSSCYVFLLQPIVDSSRPLVHYTVSIGSVINDIALLKVCINYSWTAFCPTYNYSLDYFDRNTQIFLLFGYLYFTCAKWRSDHIVVTCWRNA